MKKTRLTDWQKGYVIAWIIALSLVVISNLVIICCR